MASHILVQATLLPDTNIARDNIVNTWHFETASTPPSAGELMAVQTALHAFYTSLGVKLADAFLNGSVRYKFYNEADAPPRRPIVDNTAGGITLNGNNLLPPELCMVASYHAAFVSGTNPARRRNRVYLGPFTVDGLASTGKWSNTLVNDVKGYLDTLLAASDASSDYTWETKSTVAGTYAPVIGGWVDNAPDIKRRRGVPATFRSEFS